MNPLSAIHPFVSAEASSLLHASQEVAAPARIRSSELQGLPPLLNPQPVLPGAEGAGSFSNVLGQLVSEVNGKQMAAGETVRDLMSGQNVSLHQAVIAMEEASLSFQLMVEVRNKLLESYQELMRMQV